MSTKVLRALLTSREPTANDEAVALSSAQRAEWVLEGTELVRGPFTWDRLELPHRGVVHGQEGLVVDTLALGPPMATKPLVARRVRENRAWHLVARADLDSARVLRSEVRAPLIVHRLSDKRGVLQALLPLPPFEAFEALEGLCIYAPDPTATEPALRAATRWLSLAAFRRLEGTLTLPASLRRLTLTGNEHAYTFAGGEGLEALHLWPRVGRAPLEALRALPALRRLRLIGDGNRGLDRLAGSTVEDVHVDVTPSHVQWMEELAAGRPELKALRVSGSFPHSVPDALRRFIALEELDLRDATDMRLRVSDLEAVASSGLRALRLAHAPPVRVPAQVERILSIG